ncbi:MAG: oxidoreductase [Cereibacter sphaeroides]|uniref:Oxidoreductase n=1 Tax=Cereibacter sphaeroides TaxID=1063 RepID=A0A2W5S3V7_CERSP|nr:MAG: oxidoreductase [Cereibacter sphaeroides]
MRRIVITGASSGIGAALAQRFLASGDEVIAISRRPAVAGTRWIGADLADADQIAAAAAAVGDAPLDALIHVAGIWEKEAFGEGYDFALSPVTETQTVLAVNLTAPILLTQALIAPLSRSADRPGGRVVFVGSTSGLDNIGLPEVAYNASKAGLRAAAQAMAVALAGRGIRITMINPDDVATDPAGSGPRLTVPDLCTAIEMVLALSPETVVSEMTLFPAPV